MLNKSYLISQRTSSTDRGGSSTDQSTGANRLKAHFPECQMSSPRIRINSVQTCVSKTKICVHISTTHEGYIVTCRDAVFNQAERDWLQNAIGTNNLDRYASQCNEL